jgi:hypothetical protein
MSAFASVMCALVAMFILPAMSFVDLPRSISVDLAKVSNPRDMRGADREDSLAVAITRDGSVWLGLSTTSSTTSLFLETVLGEAVLEISP